MAEEPFLSHLRSRRKCKGISLPIFLYTHLLPHGSKASKVRLTLKSAVTASNFVCLNTFNTANHQAISCT